MDPSLFAFGNFHFAASAWLWGLLAIPLLAALALLLTRRAASGGLLERFADKHLLPLLVRKRAGAARRGSWPLLLWAAAVACGVLAMAGPRWSFTATQTFAVPDNLVIVLDLSRTMNAPDVKPSRIMRAKQEIQDLLDMRRGAQIGLVAYAAVPHMVTPLTDDIRTIRNLLPELDTSLVTLQGDALKPALEMAATMLRAEPGDDKSILVISDGEFEETDIADLARAAGGATLYTMGVGTATGVSGTGPGGETIVSRLRADRLAALAAAGRGLYVEANYTDQDTRAILRRVEGDSGRAEAGHGLLRVWDEGFIWPALVLALLLLPFFRRGAVLPLLLSVSVLGLPGPPARAATPATAAAGKAATNLFLTPDQQARAAFNRQDYKTAMAKFSTAYRRGVAAYRAADYAKAENYFRAASHQKEGVDALYDLGNAQLMQEKPEDAIVSYKTVLQHRPNDAAALHNLAIAEQMLKQDKNKKPDDKKKDDKKDDKKKDDKKDQDKNNQDKNKNDQNKNNQDKNNPNQQGGGQPPPAGQNNPQNGQPPPKQQQGQNQQGQNQPQKQQPVQQQPAKQQPAQMAQAKQSANPPPRDQKDVKADEWLGRVRNDPGSFLKNQFMIEDSEHAAQQGAPPQKELP